MASEPLELRFLDFLKIQLGTPSILCRIKNRINWMKIQDFIQKWSALIDIFKKVIGHFIFLNPKMTIRSSEIHYLQIVFSKETKIFSKMSYRFAAPSLKCRIGTNFNKKQRLWRFYQTIKTKIHSEKVLRVPNTLPRTYIHFTT